MQRINYWRVAGGGILAGVVINLGEYLVNGLLLRNHWAEAMKALNRSSDLGAAQTSALNIWGFVMGLAAVWLYSETRDRYGPGWRNALCAASAVWVIGYLSGTITGIAMGMFPASLMLIGAAAGLVEVIAGTELGAWLYKPAEP
jgi:hypothetical protein